MLVTRYGHSCLLVEEADTRLLIDPGAFSDPSLFTLGDLDGIVVTHRHADHVDQTRLDELLTRNPEAVLLADPETAGLLPRFAAHRDGDVTTVGGLTVTGVGDLHARILDAIPRITNTGVLIGVEGGPTLFHPGDSYAATPDGVDLLALPLSAPWAKISETVDFLRAVAPSACLPIHDATISDLAYDIYWGHAARHGGVEDARRIGPRDASTFTLA